MDGLDEGKSVISAAAAAQSDCGTGAWGFAAQGQSLTGVLQLPTWGLFQEKTLRWKSSVIKYSGVSSIANCDLLC